MTLLTYFGLTPDSVLALASLFTFMTMVLKWADIFAGA